MGEEIKNFVVGFFNNIGASLAWQGLVLIVTNVPENFEKYYGRKSPYQLVFEPELLKENFELITKGSFMLNCMKDFLENKGQTSIIKIEFTPDIQEELSNNFYLKNCKIDSISKRIKNESIFRFSFLTTFQYLNEKEQIVNSICIKDKNFIEFHIEDYKTSEGKKEDIQLGDIKNSYIFAKEKLKKIIEPKIQETGDMLDERLKKEIERIKQHYSIEYKEIDDGISNNTRQVEELRKQLEKAIANNKPQDFIQNIESKIKKLSEQTQLYSKEERKEQLKKEEEFFIKDETAKHSLNIDTKLINTSIIYYPIFTFSGYLKNADGARAVEFSYNPMTKEFSKFFCDCCKKELAQILLCSGGHISCKTCLRGCSFCGKDYCLTCLTKECYSCGKRLCRKCVKRCSKCGKYKCISHFNSLGVCESCG